MQQKKRYWFSWLPIVLCVLAQSVPARAGSLSVNAECVFPLLEEQSLDLELRSDFPVSVPAGTALPPAEIEGFARLNHELVQALALGGAQRVRGRLRVRVRLTGPRQAMNLVLPLELRRRSLPDPTAAFTVRAAGELPPLTFQNDQVGDVTLRLQHLGVTLVAVKHNDNPTSPGRLTAECALPGHQQRVLHQFVVNSSGDDQQSGRIRIRRESAPDSADETMSGLQETGSPVPASMHRTGFAMNALPVLR